MRKTTALLLVVITLVAGLATLCTAEKTKLYFAYWGSTAEREVVRKMVSAFEEEYPEYTVEQLTPAGYWDKLIVMITSGAELDVFQQSFENVAQYGYKGLFAELTPYVEKDDVDLSLYPPAIIEALKYKGRLYLMPKDWTTMPIAYNKSMFDEAGISYPHAGWTKEDLVSYARKMTRPDENIWGLGLRSGWDTFGYAPIVLSYGGSIFSSDGTRCALDTPEVVNAIEFITSCWETYGISPSPTSGASTWNLFPNNQVGMLASVGHWPVKDWSQRVDMGVTSWPIMVPGKEPKDSLYCTGFGIAPQSKNKDAAWKLVKFLSGEKGQQIIASEGIALPSMPHLVDLIPSREISSQYIDTVQRAQSILTNVVEYFNCHRIFVEELTPVIRGEVPPAVGIEKATKRANALLAQYK